MPPGSKHFSLADINASQPLGKSVSRDSPWGNKERICMCVWFMWQSIDHTIFNSTVDCYNFIIQTCIAEGYMSTVLHSNLIPTY